MNSHDVREAICLTLEALTPATQLKASDTFRRSEDLALGDGTRAFEVELLIPPAPAMELAGGFNSQSDPMAVDFELAVVYAAQDRVMMAQDMDQIVRAIRAMPAGAINQSTYSGQIRNAEVIGQNIDGSGSPIDPVNGFRIPRWRITVYYDSRSV